MSASVAQIGFGMALGYSATADGATPTALVDLIDIQPEGWSVGKAETTHHASPDTAEESTPGLVTYNELEVTVSWSKTQYPAFNSLKRVKKYWIVTYPDGSTDIFPGFITDCSKATPLKERMTCKIKIQPTGKSVFAAAS